MIGNPLTWWLYLMSILGPILGSVASLVLILVVVSLCSQILQLFVGLIRK